MREACGVIGIYAPTEDVARLAYFGLFALQHRGQESAGIATTDGTELHVRTAMGLVSQVFDEQDLERLGGFAAIGHTRYSTTGSSRVENAQPLVVQSDLGPLALGHNGNLTNTPRSAPSWSASGSPRPRPPTPRSWATSAPTPRAIPGSSASATPCRAWAAPSA